MAFFAVIAVDAFENRPDFHITPQIRAKLLRISPASIDST
jgi:hypothetical protein